MDKIERKVASILWQIKWKIYYIKQIPKNVSAWIFAKDELKKNNENIETEKLFYDRVRKEFFNNDMKKWAQFLDEKMKK